MIRSTKTLLDFINNYKVLTDLLMRGEGNVVHNLVSLVGVRTELFCSSENAGLKQVREFLGYNS